MRLDRLYCALELGGIRIPNWHDDAELGRVSLGFGGLALASVERLLHCSQVLVHSGKGCEKMAVELALAPQKLVVEWPKGEKIEVFEGANEDATQPLAAWQGVVLPDVPTGRRTVQRG